MRKNPKIQKKCIVCNHNFSIRGRNSKNPMTCSKICSAIYERCYKKSYQKKWLSKNRIYSRARFRKWYRDTNNIAKNKWRKPYPISVIILQSCLDKENPLQEFQKITNLSRRQFFNLKSKLKNESYNL